MKQKLMNIWSKAKAVALKCYQAAPLLCGVVVGYALKPEIKMVLDAALAISKGVLTKLL